MERARKHLKTSDLWLGVASAGCFLILMLGTVRGAKAQDSGTVRKLTLKEAVNLAVRNSRDIALARLQYAVSERQVGVARSVFRPNLYTGSGIARTAGNPFLMNGGPPPIFTLSYDEQLLNLPLRGDQHAAEQRAEGKQLSVDGVRDDVMVRAALEYLELGKTRNALDLMRGERLSAGRILEAVRDRADAGRELPIEVTRAQLTAARIEQRIAQAEDREDSLSSDLLDMMGLPADQAIEVSTGDIPGAALDDAKAIVSEAMANNVEVKEAEAEKRATEAKLRGERGSYWPTIGVIGNYNLLNNSINNYSNYVVAFTKNNYDLGVQVRIPIFSASTSAAVALARANVAAASLALDKKRNEVSLDVRGKARVVREADLGGDVARLELQVAQESVRVLQAQFDQGRGTLKDLEAAHLAENDKWLAYLDANYARQQAQLDLLRTTGQLPTVLQ